MILTNDYYSWDKECKEAPDQQLPNAVHVMNKIHGVDATNARYMVKREILRFEREYLEARNEFIAGSPPEANLIRFFSLVELGTAVSKLWHLTSPRHNPSIPVPVRNASTGTDKTEISASDEVIEPNIENEFTRKNAVRQDSERLVA